MKQCVYVELDALLDTRLATISKIDQDAAVALLKSPEYYSRLIDDFEPWTGITKETFRAEYAKRNVDTLARSRITNVPFLLKELIEKMEEMSSETPFVEDLSVVINTFPYDLTEEEQNVLISAVMARSGIETPVVVDYIPPAQLTPYYVKVNFSGMIIYNFHDWMKHHLEAFHTVQSPTMTVITPALFRDEIPKPEEYLSEGINPNGNPFQLAEVAMASMFSLSLVKVEVFSIFLPK